ncbi:MAG: hypothetical protein ACLT2V_16520 [Escherichia coli]
MAAPRWIFQWSPGDDLGFAHYGDLKLGVSLVTDAVKPALLGEYRHLSYNVDQIIITATTKNTDRQHQRSGCGAGEEAINNSIERLPRVS